VSPLTVIAPYAVSFSDLSLRPSSWLWDFGDGTVSSSQNPTHIYKSIGIYTVALTVTNSSGSDAKVMTNAITVQPCSNLPARINRGNGATLIYYSTLSDAYNAAISNDVIETLAINFIENLTADRDVSISINGGYACDFATKVGTSTLQGMITTIAGTVTIGDFELVSSNMDNNYNIVAIATSGGSISPAGTVTVAQGNNVAFTISPDPNFIVVDVLVDGVSAGAVNTYTFSGVTTNHTIEAKFARAAYTITVNAGPGGTVTPPVNAGRVVGNWNGSMTPGIGSYQDGTWYIDANGNNIWDGPAVDRQYSFGVGQTGANPIVGDWTGDGTSKLGVFRDGIWYLDYTGNGAWDGSTEDRQYSFGNSGDIPIAGDWNGDGKSEIGVYRNGTWYLDYNGNGAWDGTAADRQYYFGGLGDVPITGDWNGNGSDMIGVVRIGQWYLDLNGNGLWEGPGIDVLYAFGNSNDIPVTGDWTGDGRTKIGVLRGNIGYFDLDGNGAWNGTSIDRMYNYDDWIANRVTVPYGASQLFTITPNAGYHIADVLVDGVSTGPASTYLFDEVKADHTIEAVFSNL
jgi:PKD repeat protein